MAKLQKFSEASNDGTCPKCGYAILSRPLGNRINSNLAIGIATLGWVGSGTKKITCGAKFLQG